MDNGRKLFEIAQLIANCRRCPLYKSATTPVAGEGDPNAKVFFIGEAPGFHEDQQGRPFVGNAGQLLNRCLEQIQLKREEVFISNIVKHRPPQNRDPNPKETTSCNFWLDKQLAVIKPKIIVTLGRFSLAKFLPSKSISQVHGKVFRVGNFYIFPLFHPAAALRNQQIEKLLVADFQKLATLLYSSDIDNLTEVDSKSGQLDLFET